MNKTTFCIFMILISFAYSADFLSFKESAELNNDLKKNFFTLYNFLDRETNSNIKNPPLSLNDINDIEEMYDSFLQIVNGKAKDFINSSPELSSIRQKINLKMELFRKKEEENTEYVLQKINKQLAKLDSLLNNRKY